MRIALVSPYPDATSYGLRSVSAVLRQQGHETRFLVVPDRPGDDRPPPHSREPYSREVLDRVVDVARGCRLVGISLMSHDVVAARRLTRAIHDALGVPVVWGGFHPSVRPAECLEDADYVVVGEGEHAAAALARCLEEGGDPAEVPGLGWRRGGEVVLNPVGPLEQDLDRFPLPDWSFEGHFLLRGDRLVPASPAVLR